VTSDIMSGTYANTHPVWPAADVIKISLASGLRFG